MMRIDLMGWDLFIWFGAAAVLFSAVGAVVSMCANDHWSESSICYRRRRGLAISFAASALLVLGSFIALLWLELGRPPLRTMGETRLWYSFFALFAGLFTYLRWRYRWILSFSTVLATVFILINILRPEIHDQTLMPALQSPWFIPHVTVYMFSYSFLGCAFLLALVGLFTTKNNVMSAADTLVYIGMAFLTFGMLSGALWAKEAWGHYWNWDPKETWALITWLSYMLYIHLRLMGRCSRKTLCLLLIFSFLCLQMCWWGVNYLPTAADSVHIYNR
ncbi:MAG: cytochrome c biogenesis protein CcsA [Bacteroidales bacterium]|nr:cytochrome c biogenesis protein CcsA [Bacteroidales bacterium]